MMRPSSGVRPTTSPGSIPISPGARTVSAVDLNVQESVAADMLGDAHLAAPPPAVARGGETRLGRFFAARRHPSRSYLVGKKKKGRAARLAPSS